MATAGMKGQNLAGNRPQTPLCAVAMDRVADFAGDGETDSKPRTFGPVFTDGGFFACLPAQVNTSDL